MADPTSIIEMSRRAFSENKFCSPERTAIILDHLNFKVPQLKV